jgi:hypothetical protein
LRCGSALRPPTGRAVILEVKDEGTPTITRYRRIVVTVR